MHLGDNLTCPERPAQMCPTQTPSRNNINPAKPLAATSELWSNSTLSNFILRGMFAEAMSDVSYSLILRTYLLSCLSAQTEHWGQCSVNSLVQATALRVLNILRCQMQVLRIKGLSLRPQHFSCLSQQFAHTMSNQLGLRHLLHEVFECEKLPWLVVTAPPIVSGNGRKNRMQH